MFGESLGSDLVACRSWQSVFVGELLNATSMRRSGGFLRRISLVDVMHNPRRMSPTADPTYPTREENTSFFWAFGIGSSNAPSLVSFELSG